MDVHSPVENIGSIFPQLTDEIGTGEYLPGMGREEKEDVVFLAGERHR